MPLSFPNSPQLSPPPPPPAEARSGSALPCAEDEAGSPRRRPSRRLLGSTRLFATAFGSAASLRLADVRRARGHPTGQYGDCARAIDGSAASAAAVEPRNGGMDADGSAAQTSSVPSRQSSSARRS